MDQELSERLKALEGKIDKTFASTEETRRYFLAVLVITVIAFVLPLVGLFFAIPSMMSTYSELLTL